MEALASVVALDLGFGPGLGIESITKQSHADQKKKKKKEKKERKKRKGNKQDSRLYNSQTRKGQRRFICNFGFDRLDKENQLFQ